MNLEYESYLLEYRRHEQLVGLEYRWQYMALPDSVAERRPFLGKIREGFRTLSQIRKIHIQITVEMRKPVLE